MLCNVCLHVCVCVLGGGGGGGVGGGGGGGGCLHVCVCNIVLLLMCVVCFLFSFLSAACCMEGLGVYTGSRVHTGFSLQILKLFLILPEH